MNPSPFMFMNIDDKKLQRVAARRHKEVCKDANWQDSIADQLRALGEYKPGDELPVVIILHIFPDDYLTDAHGNPIVRVRMECQSCNASGIMDIPYEDVKAKDAAPKPVVKDHRAANTMGGQDVSHKYKG